MVVLVGHGLCPQLADSLLKEAADFFQLSMAEKMEYNHGRYGHPSGGYTPPGLEKVALSMSEQLEVKADPVESFVFDKPPACFKSPSGHGSPFASSAEYFARMEGLLQLLHRLSSAALQLPHLDEIERYYDASLPGSEDMGKNGNALRVTYYPSQQAASLAETSCDAHVRYGAHTDYQGFTILKADPNDWHEVDGHQCGGLEVFLTDSKSWAQVRVPQHLDALVINAGDLIQQWTNDRWLSPLHRVVNKEDSGRARQSLVFFTGPLRGCLITPFPSCISEEEACKHEPIIAGDHLRAKLDRTSK